MLQETINKVNEYILINNIGLNNVKLIDSDIKVKKEIESDNSIGYYRFNYLLLDNTKLGICASMIKEMIITIRIKINIDTVKDLMLSGEYSVDLDYKHHGGGGNGHSTNLQKNFLARMRSENEIFITYN